MTDKPKIEVGQRWMTRGGDIARVVATDGKKPGYPVIIETNPGDLWTLMEDGTVPMLGAVSEYDLFTLMPEDVA